MSAMDRALMLLRTMLVTALALFAWTVIPQLLAGRF